MVLDKISVLCLAFLATRHVKSQLSHRGSEPTPHILEPRKAHRLLIATFLLLLSVGSRSVGSAAATCRLTSCGSQALEHSSQLWLPTCLVAPRHVDLPTPGIKPGLLHWQADFLLLSYQGITRPLGVPLYLVTSYHQRIFTEKQVILRQSHPQNHSKILLRGPQHHPDLLVPSLFHNI